MLPSTSSYSLRARALGGGGGLLINNSNDPARACKTFCVQVKRFRARLRKDDDLFDFERVEKKKFVNKRCGEKSARRSSCSQ